MKLAVLGSGSRGNAVLCRAGGATVLIDAGFGRAALRERAAAVGMDLEAVTAVLLTHEHTDHAGGAAAIAADRQCPVFATAGTIRALNGTLDGADVRELAPDGTMVADLHIRSVRTRHDAAEPVALGLTDTRTGYRLGVAYDLGSATPRLLRMLGGVHCLLLEANHDEEMLRTGPYPASVRQRIAGPRGHLSNWQAARAVAELVHEELETVVLMHMSERCNRPEIAREVVGAALKARGYQGTLQIAAQDTPLAVSARTRQLALDLFG